MGDGGEGSRRDDHSHRPAVHANLGDGRHLRSHPRRQRYCLSWRNRQLHPQRGEVLPRVCRQLHKRRDHCQRGLRGRRSAGRLLLGLRSEDRDVRHHELGVRGHGDRRRGWIAHRARAGRRAATETSSVATVRPCPTARSGATRPSRIRSASFKSSSVTTRDTRPRWSSRSAACPRISSPKSARQSPQTAAASAPLRGCTRSAGRSTRSACSTSGARRSSSCCSGNMGRPGGGILALARPRQHPGVDRHPHAFRPASRLPAHAESRSCTRPRRDYLDVDQERWAEGFLDRGGRVSHQPA